MPDATPSLVAGRYRLDERIGSGSMGDVWRGYDTRADWTVAVTMPGADESGAAIRETLRRHAQAVAKVIHPNVAMVLDVGEHEGSPFLVTEFLTGPSLAEELAARGPLPVVEVCDLIGQAAGGLDAAHRAGLVHGKVEPDSLRLAGSGVLKVVGFRLPGQPGGDPRYQAPERRAGGDAQPASDLYGLGAVCYELLTGRPPEGTPPPPPSALRQGVPPELDRLVLAMLDPEPVNRPTGGEAVRRTLAAIARPRATMAAPSPVPGPPPARAGDTRIYDASELAPPPGRENRRLFVQAGIALAVIVAVTVGMILWAGSDGPEGDPVAATPTPTPTEQVTTEAPETPTPTPTEVEEEPEPEPEPTALRPTSDVPVPKGTIGQEVPRGGWETWAQRLDEAITAQMSINGMHPGVADRAQDRLRKAAEKFARGDERGGLREVTHVMRDLRKARDKGEIAPAGPLPDWLDDWVI